MVWCSEMTRMNDDCVECMEASFSKGVQMKTNGTIDWEREREPARLEGER